MSAQKEQILAEMGIKPIWRLREVALAEAASARVEMQMLPTEEPRPAPIPEQSAAIAAPVAALEGWPAISKAVSACQACALSGQRQHAVLGAGDEQADWFFVGEEPGAEDDASGEAFTGPAGKLLDSMLAATGLKRGENVYLAPAVKCRPAGQRRPEAGELEACRSFLLRQIELVQPKVIVALGPMAAQTLLGEDVALEASRGQLFSCQGRAVIVTCHPDQLLRQPADKARAWEDLCFAQDQMARLRDS